MWKNGWLVLYKCLLKKSCLLRLMVGVLFVSYVFPICLLFFWGGSFLWFSYFFMIFWGDSRCAILLNDISLTEKAPFFIDSLIWGYSPQNWSILKVRIFPPLEKSSLLKTSKSPTDLAGGFNQSISKEIFVKNWIGVPPSFRGDFLKKIHSW